MKLALFTLLLIVVALCINYPTIKAHFRLRRIRSRKQLSIFCDIYIKRKKGNLYTRILRSKLGRLIQPNLIKK